MNSKKKILQAAAIQYDYERSKGAPRVVAVGEGWVAEKIISLAKEHNIPLYEDAEVVARLVKTVPGSEIPPELYQAVAKILVFLFELEKEKGKKYKEELS